MSTAATPADTATRDALHRELVNQRAHVLGAVDGLSPEQLRTPALPSGWTPLGLIRHLTWDVEALWFPAVTGARADTIGELDGVGDAWQVPDGVSAGQILDDYRHYCRLADEVIAATALDAAPAWWPDGFGDWRLADLRATLLHVLVETAAHAGHLDAARELLDGRQWLVM